MVELKKYEFQEEDIGKSFLVNTISYGKITMWYDNDYDRLVGEAENDDGRGILEIMLDENDFIDEEGNPSENLIEEFIPQPENGEEYEEEYEEYKELRRLISCSKEKLSGQLYLNFGDL